MMIPKKLKYNDEIRIIAPSRTLKMINKGTRDYANRCFADMGLKVTFSKNGEISDDFMSSSIEQRIADLHEAFADKNVKCILTVIGGYNSNQLLKYIDYDLDVKVFTNGEKKLLDVEEYEQHKEKMHYSDDIDFILKENVKVLVDWINQNKGPFSEEYIKIWYNRYVELRNK